VRRARALPRGFPLLALLGALGSCATLRAPGALPAPGALLPPAGLSTEWRSLAQGIDLAELTDSEAPLRAWGVRIDLDERGLSVVCTPDNGERPGDTDGERTTSFAEREGLAVCVNASPFREDARADGDPMDVSGRYVYAGLPVSETEKRFPSILVYRDADGPGAPRWSVGYEDPADVPEDTAAAGGAGEPYYALGGFRMILRNGENRGIDGDREARTAIGTSADGRTLYLLVVDGRSRRWSVGLTSRETAEWLRLLGAADGILMDGGGSATLAVRDADGRTALANRPRDRIGIVREQVVANHFGVRSDPLTTDR
jgi:hypothetical protein